MPNIDVTVSSDLKKLFELPPCKDVKLPGPKPVKVTLPTGGSIQAFADISKGIPTDCSMSFNLMVQLAPFLAASDCLLKLLGIIAPLIDVVKGLGPPPDPIKLGGAIPKFIKAAEKLAPCLLVVTGAPLIPFIRDVLALIIKILNCFLGQLKTIMGVMNGLSLQIATAAQDGNSELQSILECARENAATSSEHLMKSIEPIGVLLELLGPILELAGQPSIQLPKVGSQTDMDSLNQVIETMQTVLATLQTIVEALGGE
ncbi:MAG TPA: hypothetical protein VN647_01645 [Nitrospira sp.]|nr:hypothetical protein [Nitrospira sp.]